MTDAPAEKPKTGDGAYALGIEMLDRGESPAAVEKQLLEMGLSAEAAKGVIASYSSAVDQVRQADGKSEIWQGVVSCGLGLIILVVVSPGSYVGWIGTILGGVQLFRGWRMSRGSSAGS